MVAILQSRPGQRVDPVSLMHSPYRTTVERGPLARTASSLRLCGRPCPPGFSGDLEFGMTDGGVPAGLQVLPIYPKPTGDDGRFGSTNGGQDVSLFVPVVGETAWLPGGWHCCATCRKRRLGLPNVLAEVLHGEGDSANTDAAQWLSICGGVQPVATWLNRRWVKGLSGGMPAMDMTMAPLVAGDDPGARSPSSVQPRSEHSLGQSNPDLLWYDPAVSAEFRLIPAPPPPLQCLAAPTSNPS